MRSNHECSIFYFIGPFMANVNKTYVVDYASLVFVPECKLEQEIQNVYHKDEYNRESRNIL